MTARQRLAWATLGAVPVAYLGWFLVWPLVAILGRGLAPHGHVTLQPLVDVVTTARTRRIVAFTFGQALLSTAVTMLVGLPAAWALYRRSWRGARVVRSIAMVPFVLPTIVMGAAWDAAVGASSPVSRWHLVPSLTVIVLAHACFNVAVVTRVVGPAWAVLDRRVEDAARVLGATRLTVWRTVTLPGLRRSLVAASAVVFLFCFTSFGIVLALGGVGRNTIETAIYRLTTQELALDRAGALVIVQIVAVLVTLALAGAAERGAARTRSAAAMVEAARPSSGHGRLAVAAALLPAATLVAVPVVALALRSGGSSFAAYRTLGAQSSVLGASPFEALRRSVGFAAVATVLAVVVGGAAAVVVARARHSGAPRRALDALVMLPLGVSAVSVGYGFLIALDRPIDLRTSWWIVPIAHATVGIPFVVRLVVPALRNIDPHTREAAAVLGAPAHVVARTIDLPIARRALVVAAGFAAAISLGEFGASSFVARVGAPTAPIAIYRLLGRPGAANVTSAYALATVLALGVAIVVLLGERAEAPG